MHGKVRLVLSHLETQDRQQYIAKDDKGMA